MKRYSFYRELRSHIGLLWRQNCRMSKKALKRKGIDPAYQGIKLFFDNHPDPGMTLDAIIIAEEGEYKELGCPVFLPQNQELLDMLWRSKMDVTINDLSAFPQCFTVAWPHGACIDGVKLDEGCMVWFGPQANRDGLLKHLTPWVGKNTSLHTIGFKDDLGRAFHLTYGRREGADRWYSRCSLPEAWMAECLRSSDDMESRLGTYAIESATELNEKDCHDQFVLTRLILNMLVYATACPESVVKGWPEELQSTSDRKGKVPNLLLSPIQKRRYSGGSHASPEPHYRNPHFRQYPLRKDGSRKPGITFVHGSMVNAGVDPSTVVKVG